MNNPKLIAFLKSNRRKNLTHEVIAAKLGCSASLLSMWMSNARKPSRSLLKPLSKLTGIKVEDLL